MSCVSLGKLDGKEEYRQVLAHVDDPENEENLMKQINQISRGQLQICLSVMI